MAFFFELKRSLKVSMVRMQTVVSSNTATRKEMSWIVRAILD